MHSDSKVNRTNNVVTMEVLLLSAKIYNVGYRGLLRIQSPVLRLIDG